MLSHDSGTLSPDQSRLEQDLTRPEYRMGEIQSFWGRVLVHGEDGQYKVQWPYALFWIAVPPKGAVSMDRYYLRLELTNYNLAPPAGCFWDVEKNVRLDHRLWPNVTGIYAAGFRTDWSHPHQLYAPWDRGGLSHPEWQQHYRAIAWKSGVSKIHDYLTIMYDILNSDHYHGPRG